MGQSDLGSWPRIGHLPCCQYDLGEFLVSKRSAISLTTLAMGVGAIFWFFAQPWTTIPWNILGNQIELPHNVASVPLGVIVFWIVFMDIKSIADQYK